MTRILLSWSVGAVVLLVVGHLAYRAGSEGRRVHCGGGALCGTVAEPSPTPGGTGEGASSLRVLSWNIAHGRGPTADNWAERGAKRVARVEKIAEVIRQQAPDIVVLNEVDFCSTWSSCVNQAETIARSAGYPMWVEQWNFDVRLPGLSWQFGNAVLSRMPLSECRHDPLPSRNPLEHWIVGSKQGLSCRVGTAGRGIRLAAIHWESRDEETRVASAARLLAQVEASVRPFVAAGDFNSTLPGLPGAKRTRPRGGGVGGANAMEVLFASEAFFRDALPHSLAPTFTGSERERVIDWIVATDDLEVARYRVLRADLSDHRPVVADLRWPAGLDRREPTP